MFSFYQLPSLKTVCVLFAKINTVLPNFLGLCLCCQFRIHELKICPGFLKSDALALARRAELQTVDANQTVFRQGLFAKIYFSVRPFPIRLILFTNNRWRRHRAYAFARTPPA